MDKKLYINPPLVNRVYDWKNGPQPKTRRELDKFFKSAPIEKVKRQICEMVTRCIHWHLIKCGIHRSVYVII